MSEKNLEDAMAEGIAEETGSPCTPIPKKPVPGPGNPVQEDRFAYVHHCNHVKRDITLCYQTLGDSSNPCLLLVSGLGSTLYNYSDEFCQKLADEGFYVVRFDNRDVGLSTHMGGLPTPALPRMILPSWLSFGEEEPPYTLHDMALDGLNMLTSLGVEKAHLLGRSMGGMIVQNMATLQPERVLSLTIVYSHSGGPNVKSQSLGTTLSYLDHPKSDSREDKIAFKLEGLDRDSGEYKVDAKKQRDVINKELDRCEEDGDGALRQLWAIQRAPSRDEDLKKLKGFPTLIVHGLQDTTIPYENGIQLSQLIGNSKLVIYPRMGHLLPQQLNDEVVSEVVLLRKVSEKASRA